jgi:hypothetical protein
VATCELETKDVSMRAIQQFHAQVASAVHAADPLAKVTTGMHSIPYMTDSPKVRRAGEPAGLLCCRLVAAARGTHRSSSGLPASGGRFGCMRAPATERCTALQPGRCR